MALELNRIALCDWAQIGEPLLLVMCNGIDNPWWTDGLETSRTEATLSTTAPDTSSMTAAETNDGAGQYADGTYSVYVTYYRDAATTYPAMESGAGTVKEVTISSGPSDILLGSVPVSGDAQVTDRRVYLLGGVLERPFYVGAIGDNTTTAYTINVAATTLQGNAVLAEATGNYPKKRTLADALPPKFEHVEVWNGRLWGSRDNVLYFSEPSPKFEDFPTTNAITIPRRGSGVGAKITQLRVHKRFLYVFFDDSVFVISGANLATFRVDQVLGGVGNAGGPRSVISIGDWLYFLDRQLGPVRWPGAGSEERIGFAVQDFWDRLDKMRLRRAVGEYAQRRGEIVWYVTEGRYDRNNRRLVFDTTTATFAVDHAECTSVGTVRNEVGEKCPLEGTSLADVFQYDLGNGDGAYAGTRSGTPTTAAGVSITTAGITLPDAADCQGRPVYTYDANGELLQDLRLITRTSATAFRVSRPVSGTVATWRIGSIPFRWESPPISLGEDGQSLWEQIDVRYDPTSTAATLYEDLKAEDDSAYENIGTTSTDDDGRDETVVCDTNGRAKRGEDVQLRLRADEIDNTLTVKEITIHGTPTGGF